LTALPIVSKAQQGAAGGSQWRRSRDAGEMASAVAVVINRGVRLWPGQCRQGAGKVTG
jgi:hypothetical protein